MDPEHHERYSRQILFKGIGEAGQTKLLGSRVAIIGCGALGTQQASLLARAGVGELVIIDRDFVEASNLQRQTLFTEQDAAERLPKAVAAETHLTQANSGVKVRGVVADLTARNIAELLGKVQLIVDGTDNFETRYVINDYSVESGIPWIYGAAVGSSGMTMTIRPGATACLACLFPEPPGGTHATCDTEGIIASAASAVASLQVAEALKLLVGDAKSLHGKLISLDVWENQYQAIDPGPARADCRCCQRREFVYLTGTRLAPVTLCGRNSVQIHERQRPLDFAALAGKLTPLGTVRYNAHVLLFAPWPQGAPYEMTVFPDGRAIIKGTDDPGVARSLYARYIGA
ncbi:MAG: ThiF family adenylyltransferase [Acidobacteria bacterium]|nr:ThiF family adenylyltransferase [Acidobacteriota bacterium]